MYPLRPLRGHTLWVGILTPAALPDFDLRKFEEYLNSRPFHKICEQAPEGLPGNENPMTAAHRL
eukprot:9531928-Alexandrium_andersonii.AAC.1